MENLNIDNLLKKINLTQEDLQCATKIYEIVVETFTKAVESDPTRGRNNNNVVAIPDPEEVKKSHKKLVRVIDLVNNDYDASSKKFKKNFPKWEEMRIESIEVLDKIVEQLRYDRKVCQSVTIAGCVVGAIGGIATLGCLLFPPAAAVVVPIAVSSTAAAGVGGGTAAAACVADIALVAKHIKHAQRVAQKDQDSELLGDFLIHSQELEKAMADLLSFDVWQKMWENLKGFNKERQNISTRNRIFVRALQACVAVAYPAQAWYIPLGIKASASILTTLIALILFHHRTRSALHVTTLVLGVFRGVGASLEIAKLISLAAKTGSAAVKLIPQVLAKKVAYGALAGVGVAIDLTVIVLSSVELHKDKICEEGQQILSVSKMLEDERVRLRCVYEGMSSVK